MKYVLLFALLLFGCNKECKDTEACRQYGQCINAEEEGRCVTGCEQLCREEGRCTPYRHSDRVECVAKTRSACQDTKMCYFDGMCSPVGGGCLAATNEDCKESMNCRWSGNCTVVDNQCIPAMESDCYHSMGCAMFGKCFLSFAGAQCITSKEVNEQVMKILGIGNEEKD